MKKALKKWTHAFPFVISDGIFIHHIIKGGSEQYENRTLTSVKASQKKKGRTREKCYNIEKQYESRPQLTKDCLVSNEQTIKSDRSTLTWKLITVTYLLIFHLSELILEM